MSFSDNIQPSVQTLKAFNGYERYRTRLEDTISETKNTIRTWIRNTAALRRTALRDRKFWVQCYSAVMPVIAILLCYAGVTLVTSQENAAHVEPDTDQARSDRQDHAEVPGLWAKGSFLAWLLTTIAIQLDVFLGRRSWLDWPRWISVMGYSATALGFQLWLAHKGTFDARYAAAQYVADKGMEALCLTYFLKCARSYHQSLTIDPPPLTNGHLRNRSVSLVWPCYALAGSWIGARAMTNGHEIYVYPQYIIKASSLWEPPIASRFRPLLPICGFIVGALASSLFARGTTRQRLATMIPAGIWTGFAILHAGLCNTPTGFALAPSEWKDVSQIFPLCIAGSAFIYGILRPHVRLLRWGAQDYYDATEVLHNRVPRTEPLSSIAEDSHELLSVLHLRSSNESDAHELQSVHYSDSRRDVSREINRVRSSRSHSRTHKDMEEHVAANALVDELSTNSMVGPGTSYGENVDRSSVPEQ